MENEQRNEFPVKVGDEIYGPIAIERLILDVKEGKLTKEARFWDGEDWVPVSIILNEGDWNEDEWDNKISKDFMKDGPPIPASSAWKDCNREGRWAMIYGDHFVVEGGSLNKKDLMQMVKGEPASGGIPLKKIINVTFTEIDKGFKVRATSFHKMYEIYSLECCLSTEDTIELTKELEDAKVRVLKN